MIIAGSVEFPDECPEDCPFKGDIISYGQNALCGRCPLFVCKTFGQADELDEIGPVCLVEPENFRRDWALVWKTWFENGMKGYPELKLKMKE